MRAIWAASVRCKREGPSKGSGRRARANSCRHEGQHEAGLGGLAVLAPLRVLLRLAASQIHHLSLASFTSYFYFLVFPVLFTSIPIPPSTARSPSASTSPRFPFPSAMLSRRVAVVSRFFRAPRAPLCRYPFPVIQQFRSYADKVVKVPEMAESISEGTLKQWSKQIGDYVEQDEEIATIETDKARRHPLLQAIEGLTFSAITD